MATWEDLYNLCVAANQGEMVHDPLHDVLVEMGMYDLIREHMSVSNNCFIDNCLDTQRDCLIVHAVVKGEPTCLSDRSNYELIVEMTKPFRERQQKDAKRT